MTQENKDLLLKDLCARLPYGVKVLYKHSVFDIDYISSMYEEVHLDIVDNYTIGISEIKPYLFPMSSMTEEQKTFFDDKHIDIDDILGIVAIFAHVNCEEWIEIIDWLNKNHFDYRGLIPMGLAIDATGLNIY